MGRDCCPPREHTANTNTILRLVHTWLHVRSNSQMARIVLNTVLGRRLRVISSFYLLLFVVSFVLLALVLFLGFFLAPTSSPRGSSLGGIFANGELRFSLSILETRVSVDASGAHGTFAENTPLPLCSCSRNDSPTTSDCVRVTNSAIWIRMACSRLPQP